VTEVNDVFVEVVINAADASAMGIASRDEIEDPLEEALSASGLGEVTGGGGGMGVYIIDVEVVEQNFDDALLVIRQALQTLNVPTSTRIKRRKPVSAEFLVYEAP
jgi:predicted nuclease with TOPRIM domain